MNNSHDAMAAQRLAQVLVTHDDPLACDACEQALDMYVEAQLAGHIDTNDWSTVAAHLDACVRCSETYALLYELRLAEARGPVPASIPSFALDFLPVVKPSVVTAGISLREALRDAVTTNSQRLRIRLSLALLALVPPPASPLGALRSAGEQIPLYELILENEGPFERVRLIVHPQSDQPEQRSLHIQVEMHGRSWPDLGDLPVRIDTNSGRRESLTDAWGEVVFDHVAAEVIPELAIEVDATPITT